MTETATFRVSLITEKRWKLYKLRGKGSACLILRECYKDVQFKKVLRARIPEHGGIRIGLLREQMHSKSCRWAYCVWKKAWALLQNKLVCLSKTLYYGITPRQGTPANQKCVPSRRPWYASGSRIQKELGFWPEQKGSVHPRYETRFIPECTITLELLELSGCKRWPS